MSDVEINELDELPQPSKRPAQRQLTQRTRPRGFFQQIIAVLMRPAAFFYGLAQPSDSRQWVMVGLLMLALIGASAVRHQTLLNGGGGALTPIDPSLDPGMGGGFEGEFQGSGDFGGDFGGVPPGVDPNAGGGVTAASTTTDDLTTALVADADVIVGWFILAVLLMLVPMFNGRAPKFGAGLQVAVWSSTPIALMAGVQLLYFAGGGEVGAAGLTGLLPDYEFYTGASPFMQAVLLSIASKFTLFWLWSVMLVYFGARYALGGHRLVVPVIVVIWVVAQIVLPVVSGKIAVPEAAPTDDMGGGELLIDPVTGFPIDPLTGYAIDPTTGYPIDPVMGVPFDPATGMPIDPETGLPVDPERSSEVPPVRSGGKPGG